MKEELKNLAIVALVTGIVLFFAIPKKNKKSFTFNSDGFSIPETSASTENEYANAVISIKAVRAAMNENETKKRIDELKAQILKDYSIRIYEKDKLLFATTRNGNPIANEQ